MELEGRLHIFEGIFIGVAFAYDDSLDADRVRHISVAMLFNDDLDLFHNPHSFRFGTRLPLNELILHDPAGSGKNRPLACTERLGRDRFVRHMVGFSDG